MSDLAAYVLSANRYSLSTVGPVPNETFDALKKIFPEVAGVKAKKAPETDLSAHGVILRATRELSEAEIASIAQNHNVLVKEL